MSTLLVTGGTGFLGTAVLKQLPHGTAYLASSQVVDLREPTLAFKHTTVQQVIHLAFPGSQGISTAVHAPLSLAKDCLRIDTNVIEACAVSGVEHLVCIGSVCEYPDQLEDSWDRRQYSEEDLLDGPPEQTNGPYGSAKRMQLALLQAAERQYGLKWCHLVLDNLYGPGDRSAHVIPSLIRRCLKAKASPGVHSFEVWGDPGVSREFVYVDDAARAVVAAHTLRAEGIINIVSGVSVTMGELAIRISDACEFEGGMIWVPGPIGQRTRWFSNRKAQTALNWQPTTSLQAGLVNTVRWIQSQETR